MSKTWEWFRGLLVRRPKQTCWVACPGCHLDLVSSMETLCTHDAGGFVVYQCARCERVSRWDFGDPVPLQVARVRLVDP